MHNDARYGKTAKFQYLKGRSKGEAAEFVAETLITENNYLPTWEALKSRYANLRLQVHHHVLTLACLPSMKEESTQELRQLVDKTQRAFRALQNLGRPVDTWDDWLVVITTERLDAETRKN